MQGFGKIKSLKIALNSDHSSKGYGFCSFENQEDKEDAIKRTENSNVIQMLDYNPEKARQNFNNNLYVKNLPDSFTQK